ncbi:MAG: alpha/beta hydrolase, partial [Actinomycetota bacterium]|nr:alpha/beta hydrolase [Actinomycetota bacterium]
AWDPDPPRAAAGPLVSDEQWAADREYVAAGLRPLDAAGRALELMDVGEGEPILYIPLMSHVEVVYARQLRDFSRDHRTLIFRREEPTDRAVGIPERVAEALAVLDTLGIDSAHIVGRGQASIVAAAFALAHPERSRSLVMVNVGMRHRVPPVLITSGINWALLHLPIEHRLMKQDGWRRRVVSFLAGPEQRLTRHQLLSVYSEIPNFIEVCKYSVSPLELDHDLRETARDLTVPTLLLGADEDPRASREDLEELAAALPDCRGVHMVGQGGRFVNYIQGDEVNRLIRAFYAGLGPQPEPASQSRA